MKHLLSEALQRPSHFAAGWDPGLNRRAPTQQGEGCREATAGVQAPQSVDPLEPLELSLEARYPPLKSLYPPLKSLYSASDPESILLSPGLSAGHGCHGGGILQGARRRRREVVVVQVHVGQEVTQGVPALRGGQAYQGGVASTREHSRHRKLAGLGREHGSGILVFPDRWWRCTERGGFQVGAPTWVGQDLAVGRRRILHQHGHLVAGRLPEHVWVWR